MIWGHHSSRVNSILKAPKNKYLKEIIRWLKPIKKKSLNNNMIQVDSKILLWIFQWTLVWQEVRADQIDNAVRMIQIEIKAKKSNMHKTHLNRIKDLLNKTDRLINTIRKNKRSNRFKRMKITAKKRKLIKVQIKNKKGIKVSVKA